ncbi:MAG: signal peptidase II [Saprospiraceae bacterium]
MKRVITILAIIAAVVGIDQWTKIWAVENVKNQPAEEYLNNFFKILYAENTGAFLGSGSDLSPTMSFWVLKLLPLVVLLGLLAYLIFTKAMPRLMTIAFSLVVGGGISNIADRFLNDGHVVDFMNMGIGDLRTGIFNFADVFIMIGIGLLLFAQFFLKEEVEVE